MTSKNNSGNDKHICYYLLKSITTNAIIGIQIPMIFPTKSLVRKRAKEQDKRANYNQLLKSKFSQMIHVTSLPLSLPFYLNTLPLLIPKMSKAIRNENCPNKIHKSNPNPVIQYTYQCNFLCIKRHRQ